MTTISWFSLAWCILPVITVCWVYWRWCGSANDILLAAARMCIQLIAVGYVLVILFNRPSIWLSLLVVSIMLSAATWIAIRPVRHQAEYFRPALIALGLAVTSHLALSLSCILKAQPWYQPQLFIPLAGMYFANTMNAISLAAERHYAELLQGHSAEQAKLAAFRAAMIPQINGLLAVGLVALPGMMTGQILSGVSPLIAVRYQIMIMTMTLGASGMGAALMLHQLTLRSKTAP